MARSFAIHSSYVPSYPFPTRSAHDGNDYEVKDARTEPNQTRPEGRVRERNGMWNGRSLPFPRHPHAFHLSNSWSTAYDSPRSFVSHSTRRYTFGSHLLSFVPRSGEREGMREPYRRGEDVRDMETPVHSSVLWLLASSVRASLATLTLYTRHSFPSPSGSGHVTRTRRKESERRVTGGRGGGSDFLCSPFPFPFRSSPHKKSAPFRLFSFHSSRFAHPSLRRSALRSAASRDEWNEEPRRMCEGREACHISSLRLTLGSQCEGNWKRLTV